MSVITYKDIVDIFEEKGVNESFLYLKSKCTTNCVNNAIKKSLDKIICDYKNWKKIKE